MPRFSRRDFLQSLAASAAMATVSRHAFGQSQVPVNARTSGREQRCDVLVVGGGLGGVAAALAAARLGTTVIITEETSWIGGQATTQGVPPDEHPWIEKFGSTRSYRDFRTGIRDFYRRHYPLTPEARADPFLNPGAAWVTALAFEPRVGLAVLGEMLAPHLTAGRIQIL